jgi:tetratricopeptide (TPR) repeat protein
MLLKGQIMAEAKSHSEAVSYFLDAFNAAPYRFEALRCLTEAYLADNRKSQALAMSSQALKDFGQTPRTLTLIATVLMAEPEKASNKKNVKSYLEKAVRTEKGYLPAVYQLVTIYMDEKNVDKAIETLTKALEFESNNRLHRMLGDCYTEKNEHDKALHHHNIASKLEVNYRSISEASQRLEHQSTSHGGHTEASLELEVDDVPESDNEVDESETDVVWSDADF